MARYSFHSFGTLPAHIADQINPSVEDVGLLDCAPPISTSKSEALAVQAKSKTSPCNRKTYLEHNKVIRAIAFAALLISVVSPVAFAHSVTMNFRFNITDINDANHTSATYVSSERDNTLAALVFAGSLLTQISLDKSSSPYLFQLTQDESQNRFLLVLTNGTWQKIENKQAGKIPATTFGDLALPTVIAKGLAVQLQFDTLDLSGMLGPGQIFIKSLGKVRLPSIELAIVG